MFSYIQYIAKSNIAFCTTIQVAFNSDDNVNIILVRFYGTNLCL